MVYRFVTYLHTRARMCIAFMCIACTRTQIDRIWMYTGQQPAKPISLTDFRSSVSTQDGQCKSMVFGTHTHTPTQNVFRSTTKIAKICNESATTQNEFRLFDQMAGCAFRWWHFCWKCFNCTLKMFVCVVGDLQRSRTIGSSPATLSV